MLTRIFLYTLRFLVVIGIGGTLWLCGLILFTRIIPSSPIDITSSTDGIVIFTGGKTRLQVALTLFQQKKGRYLLISGVSPESTLPEMIDQIPFRSQITLGYEALDTVGNAEETAAWVHTHHLKSLRLITSNYHMPRSLFELRRLLPEVEILPHPVVGKIFLKQKWWLDTHTLHLVVQEYNKFLFALICRPFKDLHGALSPKESTS
jgi:uncharacterized SAM-binding protein YcdF (DUF218 family)